MKNFVEWYSETQDKKVMFFQGVKNCQKMHKSEFVNYHENESGNSREIWHKNTFICLDNFSFR